MKLIIPILILFACFSCNSPLKSHASTDDSVSTNTETKDEPIKIGTDKILFKSFGTEPFWSAEVRKSGILFSKYGLDSITFKYVEPIAAESRPVEYFMTYFLEDQYGKQAQLVAKKAEDCACSDGMSDKEYSYHTFFLYDNQMFEGCGETVTSEE